MDLEVILFFYIKLPPRVECSPPENFRATSSIPSLASLEPHAHEAAGGYGSRRRQPPASAASAKVDLLGSIQPTYLTKVKFTFFSYIWERQGIAILL